MPPKPRKPPPRRLPRGNRNLLLALAGAAALVVVLVVVSVVVAGGGGDESSAGPTTPGGVGTLFDGIPQRGDVLGRADAPVTLLQFEDLQCPFCRRYQEDAFPDIVREYVRPGKVKLRFGGIAFLGQDSETALRYVLAAGAQGRLWQYADLLYANQGDENSGWVTDGLLQQIADELALDWDRLQTDASGPDVQRAIERSAAEAATLQVAGTPTFFVEIGDAAPYQVHPGSLAIGDFRPILDDALGQ